MALRPFDCMAPLTSMFCSLRGFCRGVRAVDAAIFSTFSEAAGPGACGQPPPGLVDLLLRTLDAAVADAAVAACRYCCEALVLLLQ